MHLVLHTVTQRMILVSAFCIDAASFVPSALGQTNVEGDISQPEDLHKLGPIAGSVRPFLWLLAAALLTLVAVLTALRYRKDPSLYKAPSDVHWNTDAQADTPEQLDVNEVIGACAVLEKAGHAPEPEKPSQRSDHPHDMRLFTPASGAAWGESMLKAFLGTCMKVNCLGRTWRESAARQVQSSSLPDPREAELIRRFMLRWQQFHVDPETGVFVEHSSSAGTSRVCLISVTKDKHTLTEAAFNAGFVLESVGRYLKSTDLVYRRGPGDYHAPTKDELAAMTPGEKDSLIRVTEIPDPWQAMIGSA